MSPYIHDKSSWTYLIVNMSNLPERKVNRGLHYYGDMVYGIYHCQLFLYILHHLANYLVVLFWRNKYFLIRALDKRSEEHTSTSELQSRGHLVCRLLLE